MPLDSGAEDHARRARGDLARPPRGTGVVQQLAQLTGFDRGPRVALTHPGARAQPGRGRLGSVARPDPSTVRHCGQPREHALQPVHLGPEREQLVGHRDVRQLGRIESDELVDDVVQGRDQPSSP